MASFAFDSYEYQRKAIRLVEVLRQSGVEAWAAEKEPLHVKLISVQFAVFGPLLGYTPLCAEPLNLLSYLVVLAVVLALGNEVGGQRVGLLSAVAVALLPTFLLHTLQLLKDPLFIAGVLILVLCVTTWLTRTYNRRAFIWTLLLMAPVVFFLFLIRIQFGIAFLAIVFLGLVLLVVRQLYERRLLYWNMASPLLLLFLGIGVLIPFTRTQQIQKFKHYPSDQSGRSKMVTDAEFRVPSIISNKSGLDSREDETFFLVKPFLAAADGAALKVNILRSRFASSYSEAGSGIDRQAEFRDFTDLLFYLPRAFEIGYWAPFPNTWIVAGQRIGSAGKVLSGAETLAIYACQLLALLTIVWGSQRLAAGLLLSVTTLAVTALGLVVPNVGALYRFRYAFWILLIILGIKGFEIMIRLAGSGRLRRRGAKRAVSVVLLAGVFSAVCSCSSSPDPRAGKAAGDSDSQETPSGAVTTPEPDNYRLTLINSTGATLRGIYLSPSDSTGWEENVLGQEELSDGGSVDISFSPGEKPTLWDLRVEGLEGHYAEWKRLDLRRIGRIRLLIGMKGEKVAVAEVE